MECSKCGCRHFIPIGPRMKVRNLRTKKLMYATRKRCRYCGRTRILWEEVPKDEADGGREK